MPVEFPIRSQDITHWLNALVSGDGPHAPAVGNVLFAWLYEDLYRVARNHMRNEHPGHTLSATALTHESWFRMNEQTRTQWASRAHFLAVASTIMRRILVHHAAAKRADKRDAILAPLTARNGLLRQGFLRVAGTMVWAVLLLSASMVLQKEAFRHASNQFLDVYLIFSLGVVLAATALAALKPKTTVARIRRFAGFKSRYIALLVFAEGVSFVGTVFSQRAIDLSPSPSFVAAIESSVPVFVMLFSLLLATVFARLGREQASTMFRNQMLGWKEKLIAIALMSSGIYCIAG